MPTRDRTALASLCPLRGPVGHAFPGLRRSVAARRCACLPTLWRGRPRGLVMRAAVSMRWVVCSMRRYATVRTRTRRCVTEVTRWLPPSSPRVRTRPCSEGYHVMRRAMLFLTLVLPVWLGAPVTALAVSGDQESPWRYVPLTGAAPAFPVRIVGQDEPWEHVVQDIQARLSSPSPGGPYASGCMATAPLSRRERCCTPSPLLLRWVRRQPWT